MLIRVIFLKIPEKNKCMLLHFALSALFSAYAAV